jgi:hypothetical protein
MNQSLRRNLEQSRVATDKSNYDLLPYRSHGLNLKLKHIWKWINPFSPHSRPKYRSWGKATGDAEKGRVKSLRRLKRTLHFSTRSRKDSLLIMIAVAVFTIGMFIALPGIKSASSFSGSSPCSGTNSGGHTTTCGSYEAFQLQPYLNSDNPSGSQMLVGWCQISGGKCNGQANLITPGHYGKEFDAPQDEQVYSFYGNPNSFTQSFSGTDYWDFN